MAERVIESARYSLSDGKIRAYTNEELENYLTNPSIKTINLNRMPRALSGRVHANNRKLITNNLPLEQRTDLVQSKLKFLLEPLCDFVGSRCKIVNACDIGIEKSVFKLGVELRDRTSVTVVVKPEENLHMRFGGKILLSLGWDGFKSERYSTEIGGYGITEYLGKHSVNSLLVGGRT